MGTKGWWQKDGRGNMRKKEKEGEGRRREEGHGKTGKALKVVCSIWEIWFSMKTG